MGVPALPFIVGCNRSGTTLLRAMLDSHRDLAVVHETRFVPRLAAQYARTVPFLLRLFLTDLFEHPSFARLGLDAGSVRTAVERAQPQNVSDAIRAVFVAYAVAAGKSRAGDKTPEYVLSMPAIAGVLPESRFIHVIRDGRDVAAAGVAAPLGPTDLGEAAGRWVHTVSTGRRDGSRLGPARYLEVRYEQLVVDPPGVLSDVCKFVELDYDEAMLRYHERADDIVKTAGIRELHDSIRKPPTPNLRDWRRDLSTREIRKIEAVAGRTLADLGYELSDKPSLRTRVPWGRRDRHGT